MKIQTSQVKELRDKTGAGILACKKALQKTEGDLEAAIDILRAEGVAKAAKRAGREAGEGIIKMKVSPDGKKAALLELKCETDFVARTDDFSTLADEQIEILFEKGEEVLREKNIQAKITDAAARIGEKIDLGRSLVWQTEDFIGGYLHHNNQLAVLVELSAPLPKLAREMAMQIAAANPPYLSESDIPAAEKDREMEIFRRQIADKPDAIKDKILAGKWRKRLTELALLNLPFIHDDKISVADYLKKQEGPDGKPTTIKAFVRWRLGED